MKYSTGRGQNTGPTPSQSHFAGAEKGSVGVVTGPTDRTGRVTEIGGVGVVILFFFEHERDFSFSTEGTEGEKSDTTVSEPTLSDPFPGT